MTDPKQTQAEETPKPKRKRELIDTGEPDNRTFVVVMVVAAVVVVAAFAYFMIFHFHDTFYERVIVEK
jgi:hypothetical protein